MMDLGSSPSSVQHDMISMSKEEIVMSNGRTKLASSTLLLEGGC